MDSHSDYESGATTAMVLLYTLFRTYIFLAKSGQSVYDLILGIGYIWYLLLLLLLLLLWYRIISSIRRLTAGVK